MENLNPAPAKKANKQSTLPQADIDRSNLAVTVSTYWATKPTITLEYISQADFMAIATAHQAAVKSRLEANKNRPQITQRLKALDTEFNAALTNVKNYISDKYGKANAQGYFPEFGITKSGNSWGLPADRDKRALALDKMLKAISLPAHGFQNNNYGKTWWTPRINEYLILVKSASDTDSATSDLVGTKNSQKDMVKKVLTSLVFVIKGNYPDTWKTVLRAWGFQKEKF